MVKLNNLANICKSLRNDTSGLALVEFAYSLPLLLGLGGYGIELANLANTNVKISLAATALADNMSRVGLESVLSTVQIRESDVNDSFIGYIKETEGLDLSLIHI
jgi:Flp pilus assembly protein TadG